MTIEGASQTADDQDADARRVEMALTALLSAPVSTSRADAGDIIATVSGHRIRVRLVGRGWPRDVEAALSKGRRRPDVVLAPSMSPGARTTAKAAGVGWMDEHGGAEFSVRSMFVSRTGGQPLGNPVTKWSPAAFATVEAILSDIPATVSAVAAATGYSVGSAAQALAFLADLGLLISRAPRGRISARFVDDPNRLLDEYASAVERRKRPRVLTVGLVGRDPVGVLASLGELWTASGIEWAATGAAAASVMAPLLTQVTTAEVFVHARSSIRVGVRGARDRTRSDRRREASIDGIPNLRYRAARWRFSGSENGAMASRIRRPPS